MIGLVLVGHAPFADTLRQCASHVYGQCPERVAVVDVAADADPATELARARRAVDDVDAGDGVLVLVDLFGATPGNIAAQLVAAGRVEVVAGANLPMLLRTLCYRPNGTLAAIAEKAIGGGASGIMKIASTSPQYQRAFPCGPADDGTDGGTNQ